MSQTIAMSLGRSDGYTTTDGYQVTLPAIHFETIIGFEYNNFIGTFLLEATAYDDGYGTGRVWRNGFGLRSINTGEGYVNTLIEGLDPLQVIVEKKDDGMEALDIFVDDSEFNSLIIKITGLDGHTIVWKYFLSGRLNLNYGNE